MKHVKIEIHDGWHWKVVEDAEPTLEITKELYDEYTRTAAAYFEIQQKIEQLFRIQQGLLVRPGVEIPKYAIMHI